MRYMYTDNGQLDARKAPQPDEDFYDSLYSMNLMFWRRGPKATFHNDRHPLRYFY